MSKVAESRSFDKETRILFSRLYGKKISKHEATEIKENFLKLLELLKVINQN